MPTQTQERELAPAVSLSLDRLECAVMNACAGLVETLSLPVWAAMDENYRSGYRPALTDAAAMLRGDEK